MMRLRDKLSKSQIGLLLLIILFLIFRVSYNGYTQRWDSSWYLSLLGTALTSLLQTNISSIDWWKQLWQNFNFLGHPSIGYTSWFVMGKFLFGDKMIDWVNIFLSVLAITGFSKIINYFIPDRKWINIFSTALFAFNPLFLATSISFNLDFPVLVFEILFISALIYKKWFFSILWGLMLVFSKETGVIIYSLIAIGYCMFFRNKLKLKEFISLFIPLLIFVASFFILKGLGWNNSNDQVSSSTTIWRWGSNCMFCFGVNLSNIKLRLFQIFMQNFGWIMLAIDILAVNKIILKLFKSEKIVINDRFLWGLILTVTFCGWLLSNLLLVVMPFTRYVAAGIFFVLLLFLLSLHCVFRNHFFVHASVLTVIICLCVLQATNSVDPMVNWLYGVNYLGSHKSSPVYGFHDGLVYNLGFTFVDNLEPVVKSAISTDSSLVGDDTTGYFFQNISSIASIDDLFDSKISSGKKWQYIDVPWLDTKDSLTKVRLIFNVESVRRVMWNGYWVDIYNLKSK